MARWHREGTAESGAPLLTVESADGHPVSAFDAGGGRVTVIISGAGLDDGRGYARLADKLAGTCRVLRLTRRRYRADLERSETVEVEDEAADVLALARAAGRPCYVFGHSAGGVVALEAALAAPGSIDALALYEPALELTALPLAAPGATVAARRAIEAGRPGRALEIFARDMAGAPAPAARVSRVLALSPRFRTRLIPGQIADEEALERLGDRLEHYRAITQHVLLMGGTRSPAHFARRLEMLHSALPASTLRVMAGAGHTGPIRRSGDLVQILTEDIDAHVRV